tara:strand:- start:700 stop:954 length:255 start_codon:yes stop_codon:yes gene_type:complete
MRNVEEIDRSAKRIKDAVNDVVKIYHLEMTRYENDICNLEQHLRIHKEHNLELLEEIKSLRKYKEWVVEYAPDVEAVFKEGEQE